MPVTYNLIASNTLSSSAASVTFSAIPGTYTDLVLRWSVRESAANVERDLHIRLNNDSTNLYSDTYLTGNGATANSSRVSNWTSGIYVPSASPGSTATSNTFSNGEMYLPSYTVSQNRPSSIYNVNEQNSTTAYLQAAAGLYRSTTAITQIDFIPASNFVSGSSFFLYGIKNS